jgi:hypothetical protein
MRKLQVSSRNTSREKKVIRTPVYCYKRKYDSPDPWTSEQKDCVCTSGMHLVHGSSSLQDPLYIIEMTDKSNKVGIDHAYPFQVKHKTGETVKTISTAHSRPSLIYPC